jgi:hypothetical protein
MKIWISWIAPVLLTAALGHSAERPALLLLDEVEDTHAVSEPYVPEARLEIDEHPKLAWPKEPTTPSTTNILRPQRRRLIVRRGGRLPQLPMKACQPGELTRVPLPDPARLTEIAALVVQLNSDDADERHLAQGKLLAAGREIVPALHLAREACSDVEPKLRLTQLLAMLEGYGPEVQGVSIKLIPDRTELRIDEPLTLRVLCSNRGEHTRILNTGGMRGGRSWQSFSAQLEGSEHERGWGQGSSHRTDRFVLLPAQGLYEETWTIRFKPPQFNPDLSEDAMNNQELHELDQAGTYTFTLTPPEQWEYNAGHRLKTYYSGKTIFDSRAEIHVGGMTSNPISIKLLPALKAEAEPETK